MNFLLGIMLGAVGVALLSSLQKSGAGAAGRQQGAFHQRLQFDAEREAADTARKKLETARSDFDASVQAVSARFEARARQLADRLPVELSRGERHAQAWLAEMIAEAHQLPTEWITDQLVTKRRPALKAAEAVAAARKDSRTSAARAKVLEYRLKCLLERFPDLAEHEDEILSGSLGPMLSDADFAGLDGEDPTSLFLAETEYATLSSAERSQRALDRYLDRQPSSFEAGRLFERFLGYKYEVEGWTVDYFGIAAGLEDLGRDLICKRDNTIHVVQAKRWHGREVRERHVLQLFGTATLYAVEARARNEPARVQPVLATTARLSDVARAVAVQLGVEVREGVVLDKAYPMIKCKKNLSADTQIYHLPFDQQYDRIRMSPSSGDVLVPTAAEAEARGFRRAFRYRPGRTL